MICTCRDPMQLGVVHRADAPCYYPNSPKEWQELTNEEIGEIIEASQITLKNYCSEEKQTEFARAIEAKLKKKNL